ncbi:cellulase [Malassezia psittaci]|uniref:Cellulase n=1 Tax=Malassezia psittaci TaxID=1821823 RepID=A0AAF0JEH4_9BASI|nr:cellulase [Malassezia psittaci]
MHLLEKYAPPLSSRPPEGRPLDLALKLEKPILHYVSPLTPIHFLLRAALVRPNHVAVTHPEARYQFTYAQWAMRILCLALALKNVPGWKRGDRVAVLSPNVPLIADAHYGVLAANGILAPLNHAAARVILVDHSVSHLLPETLPKEVTVVVSMDSGGQHADDAYEAFLMQGYNIWKAAQRPDQQPRDWSLLEQSVDELETCALCYTSGTTGRPKGVEYTYRGCYMGAIGNAMESDLNGDTVYLWVLPMFHCCGWTFPWAVTARMGTHYMLRQVDYAQIWDALLHSGVTHYSGAPTVQLGVVNHRQAQKLPHMVRVSVAASAPSATLLGRMESLNLQPVHVYGLTETYGPNNRRFIEPEWLHFDLDTRSRLQARQGHAMVTSDETRVVQPNETSSELIDVQRDGKQVGEIVMRGNVIMKGYYRDPDATKQATRGNYFHTGDLAVRHPGGEAQILDRGKDIIISGGENISSVMVEQELAAHPWVAESAVVARAHPQWVEAVQAFVILSPEGQQALHNLDDAAANAKLLDTLNAHCRNHMSKFAIPKWYSVVTELPKTSTGKIQKKVLRERLAKL